MSDTMDMEKRMLQAASEGFWLGAHFGTLAYDQLHFETLSEHSRFYVGDIPASLRALLSDVFASKSHDTEASKALTATFNQKALASLLMKRPDCPYAQSFVKHRIDQPSKHSLGRGLVEAQDPQDLSWGSFELFCADYDFLVSPDAPDSDYQEETASIWGIKEVERLAIRDTAAAYCESILDALEEHFSLQRTSLVVCQGQLLSASIESIDLGGLSNSSRIRTRDEPGPWCLESSFTAHSRSLMERHQLDFSIAPASTPKLVKHSL